MALNDKFNQKGNFMHNFPHHPKDHQMIECRAGNGVCHQSHQKPYKTVNPLGNCQ
jgi:hypothetical protein